MRYEVVSLFSTAKRPFARPSRFTNKAVALKHARNHGNMSIVYDTKSGAKVRIYQTPLTKAKV